MSPIDPQDPQPDLDADEPPFDGDLSAVIDHLLVIDDAVRAIRATIERMAGLR